MPARSTRTITRSPDAPLHQLKITLKWSRPSIWRRVVVRGDMTLDRLNEVIQIAMGWTNSHLHEFSSGSGFVRRTRYGQPDPHCGDMTGKTLDERHHTVAEIAPAAKRKFTYEYDFGDSWEHDVVAEKILPPDPAFEHPVCLAGANACPPEDCGGIPGYHRLLEIMADPRHPEHEGMRDGMGGERNAEEFSAERINAILKRLKA